MPASIFAIANQKGGVGKTTTSVNLAAALALMGQRTLLIDLDPQGNSTMGCGIDKRNLKQGEGVYPVLLEQSTISKARHIAPHLENKRLHLLAANRELAGAEVELVNQEHREMRLKEACRVVENEYDFILIDSPPSLSLLTLNGLCAAHGVIIPMQCEYYALEGLSDLVNTVRKVAQHLNRDLKIIGLLRVMYDARSTLTVHVSKELEKHFGDKVFRAIIPRNVRLAEAPSHGQPGVIFDRQSRGAVAYLEFSEEMIQRVSQGLSRSTSPATAPI